MSDEATTTDGATRADAVVVSHETRSLLEGCLRSLSRCGDLVGEITVVDNASSDGSPRTVGEILPHARLVANPVNLGFARGANQGLRHGRSPFVLLLNADVSFEPEALAALLSFAERHEKALLTVPRLRHPDGSPQASCRSFYDLTVVLLRRTPLGRLRPDHPALRRHLQLDADPSLPRPVDWAMGAAWLLRRSAIEKVGLLDERYFLYLEDVDYCWRIRRAGGEVWYAPQSVMTHHYGRGSRGFRPWKREVRAHALSALLYAERWSDWIFRLRTLLHRWATPLAVARDLVVLNLSFVAALCLRRSATTSFDRPLLLEAPWQEALVAANLVLPMALHLAGAYAPHDDGPRPGPLLRGLLVAATILGGLLMLGPAYRTGFTLSRSVAAVWAGATVLGLAGVREIGRRMRRRLRREGFGRRRFVVRGRGAKLEQLVAELLEERDEGWELCAWIDPPATWRSLVETQGRWAWQALRDHKAHHLLVGEAVGGDAVVADLARCLAEGTTLHFVGTAPPFALPQHGTLVLGRRCTVVPPCPQGGPAKLLRSVFHRVLALVLLALGLPRFLVQRGDGKGWSRDYVDLFRVLAGSLDLVGAPGDAIEALPPSLAPALRPALLPPWPPEAPPVDRSDLLRLLVDRMGPPGPASILEDLRLALAFLWR